MQSLSPTQNAPEDVSYRDFVKSVATLTTLPAGTGAALMVASQVFPSLGISTGAIVGAAAFTALGNLEAIQLFGGDTPKIISAVGITDAAIATAIKVLGLCDSWWFVPTLITANFFGAAVIARSGSLIQTKDKPSKMKQP